MRTLPTSLALIALCSVSGWSGEAAPPAPTPGTATPDQLATGWAQALKRNDLSGAFALFTPADQASLANLWRRQMARPDAYADVQLDTLLRLAQNPTGAEQVLAMAQPYLGLIDVPRLTKGIGDIAGFLGTAAEHQAASGTGLDYAGLRGWLQDLAAWVPTAGLGDQTKAKAAAGHLVRAVAACGLKSAAEARALPLAELLVRLDPALPALKDLLLVYDVQVDAALGSFTAALGEAGPGHATITLGFTSLGKPRTVKLRLEQKNGAWQLASGNDNPITGLSQLVMMALLMQGFAGEPAAPPAPVTPPPEDDGAL